MRTGTQGTQGIVAAARERLRSCALCARHCGVNRLEGERGYCGLGAEAFMFRELVHYGLELELIPAHAVYLAGCNMRCVSCTVEPWNRTPRDGTPWDVGTVTELMERRRAEGARTLLFVGGEPTVSLHTVLGVLDALSRGYRVALDSNMYFSPEARELLQGAVDVYVADFKFGNDRCARELADAPDYVENVVANLQFAEETSSLIVRHLLMPGHLECCFKPALERLKRELRAPRLSLRIEYMPPARLCGIGQMDRYLTRRECEEALALARDSGIELVE